MFHIGDQIAHPMHGAGIIDDIIEQLIDGKPRMYYVLKLSFSSMTLMIPCDLSTNIGMRDIIEAEVADELISVFPGLDIEDNQNWNKRYRENMTKLKSGDLMQVCGVVKSLLLRDREKGLSTGERKLLTSAKQILISEVMLAKDASYEEVEHMFEILFD